MDIKTQNYLQSLNTNRSQKSDKGLTLNELKASDTDRNGQLSKAETQGQIGSKDLDKINQKLKVSEQVLKHTESIPFIHNDDPVLYSEEVLNSRLFPGGVEGINPNDIQQGHIGDCFFLSGLTSLAKHKPEKLISMIDDLGKDHYQVTFPGAKHPVTVSLPSEDWQSKTGYDALNQKNGSIWVQVLEKAFVEYAVEENTGSVNSHIGRTLEGAKNLALGVLSPSALLAHKLFGDDDGEKPTPREHFKNGGLHSDSIRLLTNHGTDDDIIALTRDSTTRSKLKSHLAKGDIVLASTAMGGSVEHNIGSDHVYSVLSYDASKDTLLIRNPHGSGSDAKGLKYTDTQNDGVYKITLTEFNRYFNLISYEESGS